MNKYNYLLIFDFLEFYLFLIFFSLIFFYY